jgi:phage terminase large subunit-like protein
MGLRGPGAKPKLIVKPGRHIQKIDWERPGLSRVARVIGFLESLPVTSGVHVGRKFRVRPWQAEFLEEVYAETNGSRKVRTAVLSLGRKNGKTALAAPLALCHMSGPEAEERGEIYSAANDRYQATRVFNEMFAIIQRTEFLSSRINVKRHDKTMEDMHNGSIMAALSADVATKHGLSPSFTIYDELGQAPSRSLFDALDTAMGARAEPMMMVISTQAATDLAPMSELIDYGLKVNSGEILDPSFHLTFYGAPVDADPWAEETWRLANPALGDFRSLEDVQRMAAQAKRLPAKEPAFRNLILNQRVDGEAQFLPRAEWMACGGPVNLEKLKGRECYAGLDLGTARDFTALVLVFPRHSGACDVVAKFWTPKDTLDDREHGDRAPYRLWTQQGFLTATPGRTIDLGFVAKEIGKITADYNLRSLAYDRWRIEDLKRELDREGVAWSEGDNEHGGIKLIPFGQGFKDMGPAVEKLMAAVVDRRLRHGGNPVLTMCVANAKTVSDPAGNLKLDKSRSTGRIDGAVALAMGLAAASMGTSTADIDSYLNYLAAE